MSAIVSQEEGVDYPELLVGNKSNDDAAAYDMGDGTAVLSTTDFFMPIIDDPFTFGKIAATNALSDVYAMGGYPIMALAILGWPIGKLEAPIAKKVLEGGRAACKEAGIMVSGGHSIDSPEPIYGLSVNGRVEIENIKTNDKARKNSLLFLTKSLGIGILTTASKKKLIEGDDIKPAVDEMCKINKIGREFGKLKEVSAMTDITGFGLLGHLYEMCSSSKLSAEIHFENIDILPNVDKYIEMKAIPGGARNNQKTYGKHLHGATDYQKLILSDPQTSGGLLVAVDEDNAEELMNILNAHNLSTKPIGRLVEKTDELIKVI